jgi:NADPH:quinone reductase-like Zn-dependent oxidoreductase
MRGFVLDGFDAQPRLRDDLPAPDAREGELAVRVLASSVNPVDNAIAAGMLREMYEHEFPVTLGRDFAGVVEAVGSGTDGYAVGDEVFGFLLHADPAVGRGSWSELAIVPAVGLVAAKPAGVGFDAAGAAPLAALTAIAALDALELTGGETLLIVGGTGGVGSFATQLAKRAGAHVIVPGLSEDREFLDELGADEMVARDGDVVAAVRELEPGGAEALIDAVSSTPEDLEVFAAALAEGGRVASSVGAAGEGPGRFNVMGSADPEAIHRLAALLENGELWVPIQRTYGLERAGEALSALSGEHTQGKLALAVAD